MKDRLLQMSSARFPDHKLPLSRNELRLYPLKLRQGNMTCRYYLQGKHGRYTCLQAICAKQVSSY